MRLDRGRAARQRHPDLAVTDALTWGAFWVYWTARSGDPGCARWAHVHAMAGIVGEALT